MFYTVNRLSVKLWLKTYFKMSICLWWSRCLPLYLCLCVVHAWGRLQRLLQLQLLYNSHNHLYYNFGQQSPVAISYKLVRIFDFDTSVFQGKFSTKNNVIHDHNLCDDKLNKQCFQVNYSSKNSTLRTPNATDKNGMPMVLVIY